jgi:hypothetical protein
MDNFSTATSGIEFPRLDQDEFHKVIEELDKTQHSEDNNKIESIIITNMSMIENNKIYMKMYNNKKYVIMREEYLNSLVYDGLISKSDPKEYNSFQTMLGVPIEKNDRFLLKVWYGIVDEQKIDFDYRSLYRL